MTSMYFQPTIEQTIIHFPKKVIHKTNKIPIVNSSPKYDLFSAEGWIDPNNESSPPNVFITTLQRRMDVFYSTMSEISVAGNARNRALSFGYSPK